MDCVENRLDQFLSTAAFKGFGSEWGYSSKLYHYSSDACLEDMRKDLCAVNLETYKECGEFDEGLVYLSKRNFSIDDEIWHVALDEFNGGDFWLAASRRYWIFSLCREGRSELMWENYSLKDGRGNPCVMVFDGPQIYKRVVELISEDLQHGYSPSGTLHFFLPCFYHPRDGEKIQRLAEFITGNDYYGYLCSKAYGGGSLKDADRLVLAKDLIAMFALMIKNGSKYQDERETRLIVVGDRVSTNKHRSIGLGFDPISAVRYSIQETLQGNS